MRKWILSMMVAMGCFAAVSVSAQEDGGSVASSEESSEGSSPEIAVEVPADGLHDGCGCGSKGKKP